MNWHGKSYNFFGDTLFDKFGCRVLKLPVNANLSCPNRDGKLGSEGCIFCSEDGSASPTSYGTDDILLQMKSAKSNFKRADKDTRFIAYFQAYTNTYAPVDQLKKLYDTAVSADDIVGLMIGTRPDCLSDEVLDLISSYKKNGFELWVEIGMQSSHDRSLELLNRRHTHADNISAIERASARGIKTCGHIILGIPGETWNDMMDTAEFVSSSKLEGIKMHQLHIIKNTRLEKMYYEKKFSTLTMKEYASSTADFIERTRPDILIHRLLGDRNESTLVAPLWGMHKGSVIKAIEEEFANRGTWQGFLCG